MTRRILYAALFLSLAWTTAPALLGLAREAIGLRSLSLHDRRAKLMAPFYESAVKTDGVISKDEPVALVLRKEEDLNPAIFFNYYAYPRTTRIFRDLRAYREAKERPRQIVRVAGDVRPMTYEQVRAQEIGREFFSPLTLPAETTRNAIVPIVASVDGPPPDNYRTEAAIENASDVPVRVGFELFPWNRIAPVVLEPGERRTWNDFVYVVFDLREQGWLRLTADGPVRARFWFVNRGRRDVVELPFVEVTRRATLDSPPGAKLWMLNPNDSAIGVEINGVGHLVKARDWSWIPREGHLTLDSAEPFVAYVSWRDRDGRSRFTW